MSIRINKDDFLALCLSMEAHGGVGAGRYVDAIGRPFCVVGHACWYGVAGEYGTLANRMAGAGLFLEKNDCTVLHAGYGLGHNRMPTEDYWLAIDKAYGLEITEDEPVSGG